jgi:hypothetical protein
VAVRCTIAGDSEHDMQKEQGMVWRLYDTLNGCWYNDELYDSREACIAAGTYYTQAAHVQGEVLALVAEPLDPIEAIDSLEDEEEGL